MSPLDSRDLEETTHRLRQIYPPFKMRVDRYACSHDFSLRVSGPKTWPIVWVRYGAPVVIDTDLQELIVIKRCDAGAGSVRQNGQHALWSIGSIIPLSSRTQLSFRQHACTVSVKLARQRLELLCERLLGHPLDVGLQFCLVPFSELLRRVWNDTLALVDSYASSAQGLPAAAEAALEVFVQTLLLQGHPHNYSGELSRPEGHADSRTVRRAVEFMEEHAGNALTVPEVAAAAGTSVRALQEAFRKWHQVTPSTYLRDIRLRRVRDTLLNPDASMTVTEVALRHGFFHLGHFGTHYKVAFGETPTNTLARARRSQPSPVNMNLEKRVYDESTQ